MTRMMVISPTERDISLDASDLLPPGYHSENGLKITNRDIAESVGKLLPYLIHLEISPKFKMFRGA